MALRLGIWESAAVDLLVSGLHGSGLEIEPVTIEASGALAAVRSGTVDVALVPTLDVICGAKGIEVLPAVALSSWHNPFARIHLPLGLGTAPGRVLFERETSQEALVARVVLKEHYSMEPEFVVASPEEIAASDEARLLVGRDVPVRRLEGSALDLGEEWFEAAAYPMVWGVFVVRKGAASMDTVDRLRIMVERSESLRSQWADRENQEEAVRRFFEDDVRFRFDDLAAASITELMEHAFFYDLTDEIREFPLARPDEREDEADADFTL